MLEEPLEIWTNEQQKCRTDRHKSALIGQCLHVRGLHQTDLLKIESNAQTLPQNQYHYQTPDFNLLSHFQVKQTNDLISLTPWFSTVGFFLHFSKQTVHKHCNSLWTIYNIVWISMSLATHTTQSTELFCSMSHSSPSECSSGSHRPLHLELH